MYAILLPHFTMILIINLVQNIKFRTDNFQKRYLKDVFQDVLIVLAQQHPKNMVRTLTNSFFTHIIQCN